MARWPKQRLVGWLSIAITAGVCAAQTLPPNLTLGPSQTQPASDPTAAKVVELVGDVSVLKDSYPWALNVGDTVKVQQVILTGPESYAVFQLSDGSRFEVFPNSRLTFRSNPGDWRDLLDLWIGQVKVYIQKLGGQPNPHRIFTPTAVISVRGTVFGIAIVDEDDTTLVSVDEGQVSVRHRLIGESNEKLVNAGEYLQVYKNEPLARSIIDKGSLFQKLARSAAEALYTVLLNRGAGVPTGGGVPGSTGGSGGPTLPGDTGSTGGDTTPAPPGDPAPPTGPPPPPPGG